MSKKIMPVPMPPATPAVKVAGDWLFQIDGVIYGPVPAATVVERLFKGELSGSTLIAEPDGEWTALGQHQQFAALGSRAERELAAYQAALADYRGQRKRRKMQFLLIGLPAAFILLLSVVVVIVATRIPARPRTAAAAGAPVDWADRPPPIIALGEITSKVVANNDTAAEKEKRQVDVKQQLTLARAERRRQRAAPAKTAGASQATAPAPAARNQADADFDEAPLRETVSDQEIQVLVRRYKTSLYKCIEQEYKGNPMMPTRFSVEFVIQNSGQVGSMEVQNPLLQDTDMEACFKKIMGSWRFPEYYGEQKVMVVPFFISQ